MRTFGWRRPWLRVHPAKPKVSLRTTRADEMWHIDTSVIRLLDGTRTYLHAVIDNRSRRIVAWRAADTCAPLTSMLPPLLASARYRVIVPYLRGYGTTRFLSSDTVRNGQQSALASDTVELMDALGINKAGCDWGSRTANIVAALWPERCKTMVSVSGI
jgi:hypothetical protein